MDIADRVVPVWKESRGLIDEFRAFIRRGNVIDLAVGVIMGAAFGRIVSSLVGDVLMPLIGYALGSVDLKTLVVHIPSAADPRVTVAYGQLLQAILDFIIIASCVFILVKVVNRLHRKTTEPPKDPSDEVKLLMEIRDLLKERPVSPPPAAV
jgi:large conductance mechanosensitive channel